MDYPRLVNCSNLDRVYQEARFSYAETVEYREHRDMRERDKEERETKTNIEKSKNVDMCVYRPPTTNDAKFFFVTK